MGRAQRNPSPWRSRTCIIGPPSLAPFVEGPLNTSNKVYRMAAKSAQACASEFTSCLVRRDINAALMLLTDDVVFFYSNGSVIIGKDAFAAAMTANWKMVTDYEYSTVESNWIVESDTAAS